MINTQLVVTIHDAILAQEASLKGQADCFIGTLVYRHTINKVVRSFL